MGSEPDTQAAILAELKQVNENLRTLHDDIIKLQSVTDSVIAAITFLPDALRNLLKQGDPN